MATKKRKPQDTTLRNTRASNKRIAMLEKLVDELVDSYKINNPHFYRHLVRVKNG